MQLRGKVWPRYTALAVAASCYPMIARPPDGSALGSVEVATAVDAPHAFAMHLRACTWRSTPASDVFFSASYFVYQINGTRKYGIERTTHHEVVVPSDVTSVDVCKTGGWSMVRVGPFSTHGGSAWDGFQGVVRPSSVWMSREHKLHDHVALSAYAIVHVDAVGVVVGYPPLLTHHFHIGSVSPEEALYTSEGEVHPPEIMSLHGENHCDARSGGDACLVHVAPEGTAFVERFPVALGGPFNDVRPRASVPLRSWQVVAVRQAWSTPVMRMSLTYMMVRPPPFVYNQTGTYLFDTGREAATWTFRAVDIVGTSVTESLWHMHNELVLDAWLFLHRPEDVFGNVSAARMSRNALDYTSGAIDAMRDNVRRGRALPTCEYASARISEEVLGVRYFRKTLCSLPRRRIRFFLMVVLHRSSGASRGSGNLGAHSYLKVFHTSPIAIPYHSNFVQPP